MRTLLLTLTTCLSVLPATAKYSGGTGEPNDPYQIATAADLIALGETPQDYGKHFILTADIDLDPNLPGRKVFDKAVIAPDANDVYGSFEGTSFTGVLDGNGHTILHLTIKGRSHVDLFGQLGSWDAAAGEVRNIGLADVNTTGSGDVVGGLVGENYGVIATSYSPGTVNGATRAGGIVGYNSPDASSAACFWDVETSGLVSSDGGIGKTTAQMQTASTFLEAGWDFVDETANGSEDIWWIDEGKDYPRLWWEAAPREGE